jgi:hypothetical protein
MTGRNLETANLANKINHDGHMFIPEFEQIISKTREREPWSVEEAGRRKSHMYGRIKS